jgi:hypothetical protein
VRKDVYFSMIFIPPEVPAAGSPKYAKPPKPNDHRHKAQRPPNLPIQAIPRPQIDRQLVDQLLRQGKQVLAEAHGRR